MEQYAKHDHKRDIEPTLVHQAGKRRSHSGVKLHLERHQSPSVWAHAIVDRCGSRVQGVVEQRLVGATLQCRHPSFLIPNHPAHAGDQQTARDGDFTLPGLVYHVTAFPTCNVIEKCLTTIRTGQHPMLLVPQNKVERARILAQDEHIEDALTIVSIEDYITITVIEMATFDNLGSFDVMTQIVNIYNDRLAQVETDQSLQIQLC